MRCTPIPAAVAALAIASCSPESPPVLELHDRVVLDGGESPTVSITDPTTDAVTEVPTGTEAEVTADTVGGTGERDTLVYIVDGKYKGVGGVVKRGQVRPISD